MVGDDLKLNVVAGWAGSCGWRREGGGWVVRGREEIEGWKGGVRTDGLPDRPMDAGRMSS